MTEYVSPYSFEDVALIEKNAQKELSRKLRQAKRQEYLGKLNRLLNRKSVASGDKWQEIASRPSLEVNSRKTDLARAAYFLRQSLRDLENKSREIGEYSLRLEVAAFELALNPDDEELSAEAERLEPIAWAERVRNLAKRGSDKYVEYYEAEFVLAQDRTSAAAQATVDRLEPLVLLQGKLDAAKRAGADENEIGYLEKALL